MAHANSLGPTKFRRKYLRTRATQLKIYVTQGESKEHRHNSGPRMGIGQDGGELVATYILVFLCTVGYGLLYLNGVDGFKFQLRL
ncbi:hypothetical protein BJX76DRAFT_330646 [Aspergillus varians]